MKKVLTTLASLALVSALLLALCPMTIFAEGLDDLTIESITNGQPANMITEALSLAEGYTWTASPAGVVDTATGAVTQDLAADKMVTLTADDGAGNTKDFSLTVKSKTTNVIYSDDFHYPQLIDWTTVNNGNTYKSVLYFGSRTGTKFALRAPYAMDDVFVYDTTEKNYYLSADFNKASNQQVYYNVAPGNNVLNISFDAAGASSFDLFLQLTNTEDATKSTNVRFCRVTGNTIIASYGRSNSESITGAYDGTSWCQFTIQIDPVNGTFKMKKPDGTWTTTASYMFDTSGNPVTAAQSNAIAALRIHKTSGGAAAGALKLDNFSAYTTSIDNLTENEKLVYYQAQLAENAPTTESAAAVTGNLTLNTFGGAVTWETSNESVIETDGTVHRPTGAVAGQAVLTAKYNGTVLKTYHFSVAPANFATVAGSTTKSPAADDFEDGTAGNAVTYHPAAVSSIGGAANKKWQYNSAEALMTYASDSLRGMAAKLDNTAGATNMEFGYMCGAWNSYTDKRVAVGFDFKPEPDTNFTYSFNGSDKKIMIDFAAGQATVHSYTKTSTYFAKTVALPATDWVRVDIDINFASRTQMVYLNGTSVSGDIPMMQVHYDNELVDTSPVRNMSFTVGSGTSLLLDNVAVLSSTDTNADLADAGVKAAQVYFTTVGQCGTITLPSYGPASINAPQVDRLVNSPFTTAEDGTKGAALSWTNGAESVTGYSNSTFAKPTLTVTATAGSATKTADITFDYAPVILAVAGGKVTATGSTEGGKLIIAKYTDSTKTRLDSVVVSDTFENVEIGAANYKVMFVNDLTRLQPIAFSK